jgi:tRNA 2-thiouridine synthesizing protein C
MAAGDGLDDELLPSGGVVKRFLYVVTRAPHGSIYGQEALEAVLAGAAFGQEIAVLFLEDGVFQLKKGQDPVALELKNFALTYRALEMYDVEKLYVDRDSLQARGLGKDDLLVPVELLTSAQIGDLMNRQHVILTF